MPEKYLHTIEVLKEIGMSILDAGAGITAIVVAFDWWSIDGIYKLLVMSGVLTYMAFRAYHWYYKGKNEKRKFDYYEQKSQNNENTQTGS